MKKYLVTASLFLLNNEIISWLAITAIALMAVCAFLTEAEKGGAFK